MSEKIFDKTEHVERIRNTENELVYKKLCDFERNYCENIHENSTGAIVYEVDSKRLAELENISKDKLKELDFLTVEYPSYERLFNSKYKDKFLKNVAAIRPKELESKLGRDTLDQVMKKDPEIKLRYAERRKEVDLDIDGVPDRIDIDDTKNRVQTVADLNIVKNATSKDTSRDHEKVRERKKNDIEL
jgi:hypothetical protein